MSRRRALGRGLDSLLGPAAAEPAPETPGAPLSIPLDRLRPNRRQPRQRLDEDGLTELAESIRAQGVVQPIVVTPAGDDAYTIVAGERRWRAARRAGLEAVPVVVREVEGERELLELALVENLQRSDLDPVEEAEAFRMLGSEFGLTPEQIGERVGKDRTTIHNALKLLELSEEVLEMLRTGELKAGHARRLSAAGDERRQLSLARRIVHEGLSVRAVEALTSGKAKRRSRRSPAGRRTDPETKAAEETLTRRLQTRVEIHRGRGRHRERGEVRLHFHSEEELSRLYDLLIETGKRP